MEIQRKTAIGLENSKKNLYYWGVKNLQIENYTANDLLALIGAKQAEAYKQGYKDAYIELEAEKKAKNFGDNLFEVKGLYEYIKYKGYYNATLAYLKQTDYKLLAEPSGGRLKFQKWKVDQFFKSGEKLKRRF